MRRPYGHGMRTRRFSSFTRTDGRCVVAACSFSSVAIKPRVARWRGSERIPAKGGIYNLHQSLWWLVHHWATFRRVFATPVPLTRPRLCSSTLHNINLSFRWVDASRPFQAILCAIFVINYSDRYFCNVVLSRRAGISRGDRGECWIIAHGLSDFSTGFHFSKQTAFTFLVDGEISFRWISVKRWIFREIFRDFGVLVSRSVDVSMKFSFVLLDTVDCGFSKDLKNLMDFITFPVFIFEYFFFFFRFLFLLENFVRENNMKW